MQQCRFGGSESQERKRNTGRESLCSRAISFSQEHRPGIVIAGGQGIRQNYRPADQGKRRHHQQAGKERHSDELTAGGSERAPPQRWPVQ